MKIGIDIDGVISDFVTPFCELVQKEYGVTLRENNIYVHDLYLVLGISKKEALKLIRKNIQENDLELMPGAYEGLQQLVKEHTISILTARPKDLIHITEEWLERKKVPYHKLIHLDEGGKFLAGKNALLDIFIDDNLEEAIKMVNKVKWVLIFDHPWNKTLDVGKQFIRVRNWHEITESIKKIVI